MLNLLTRYIDTQLKSLPKPERFDVLKRLENRIQRRRIEAQSYGDPK
jgi:hypothetical protein